MSREKRVKQQEKTVVMVKGVVTEVEAETVPCKSKLLLYRIMLYV